MKAGLLAGLVFGFAAGVGAQTSGGPAGPRIDIGLLGLALPAAPIVGPGVRVTLGGNGPVALEVEGAWMEPFRDRRYAGAIIWFYSWQVRHTIASDGAGRSLFATYGTAGWSERHQDFHARDRFTTTVTPPIFPVVGIGGQQPVSRFLAIRGDAQLMIWPGRDGFVAPRVSAGVAIPIGGFRSR